MKKIIMLASIITVPILLTGFFGVGRYQILNVNYDPENYTVVNFGGRYEKVGSNEPVHAVFKIDTVTGRVWKYTSSSSGSMGETTLSYVGQWTDTVYKMIYEHKKERKIEYLSDSSSTKKQ